MINLGFFPSRRLAFYMVRLFITRSLAVLIALVLVRRRRAVACALAETPETVPVELTDMRSR